jgi:hypothetical protein
VSSEAAWLPLSLWHRLGKGQVPPEARTLVVAVERSLNWDAGTVVVAGKVGRTVYTEVAASLVHPNLDQLEDLCVRLWRSWKPAKFFMRSQVLKDLSDRLRERGLPTEYLTAGQFSGACATAYRLIADGHVVHGDDPVVAVQMPRAVAKNSGDGWLISARDSSGDVDAVMATVVGLYGAEVTKPMAPMLTVA